MSNKLNKVLKISSSVIVSLVVLLAFLLIGVRLFGIEPYTVLSGSMEPEYPTGSLIYVVDTDTADIEVNDVITFKLDGGSTATHRIIELVPDDDDPTVIYYRTKGDNNDIPDGSLVEADRVIGKPVFCIPLLGFLAAYIQQPPGSVVAITVAVVLIVFVMMADVITDDKKKNNGELHKGDS